MKCPICRKETTRLFLKHKWWIRECEWCTHRNAELEPTPLHLEQVYGDDYFDGGGSGYVDYFGEAKLLRQRGQWYACKLRRHMQPGRLLDVGAAAGFILQGFLDKEWQGDGIEPNVMMANHAKEALHLSVCTTSLEDYENDAQYDLVSMIQVIAHFFDLRQAMKKASTLTRSGGHLLIETWNYKSLTARFFGKSWHEYSPPSVLHWFSRESLRKLCLQFGFVEVASGRPSKWLKGGHARSLLNHTFEAMPGGRLFHPLTQLIPKELPIPYPSEDLFWALFQKQET